ncbi:MAG: Zn-dependent exopeptidase M28 [Firmicutes bacterium]|nr:Zn-dependent exopeptidase M28 [Bacillota bacterium]
MNIRTINQIIKDTDYIHTSGTLQELQVARYLMDKCQQMGIHAYLEAFPVEMANVKMAKLMAYQNEEGEGTEVPCKGFKLCGSGSVEAPLYYMPNQDQVSLQKAKGKIVLVDSGMHHFLYQDLIKAGAAGFITYTGNVNFQDTDIDQSELRSFVRGDAPKILGAAINAKTAFELVKRKTKRVKIEVDQEEYEGESHNVIAEIPGTSDEWIVLTAHYDTVPLSRGSYDNMSGCIGVLEVLEALKEGAPHRYGIRAVFCGSEERGLLGSKAYTAAHKQDLDKVALNVNLDMIGSVMGKFIAVVSAEEALVSFIRYFAAKRGWGIDARTGVYSSDSTPFADGGVPALSFARITGPGQSNIHSRYDTPKILSAERLKEDGSFIAEFVKEMADAVCCPVKREMPEKIKEQLDEYLNRKRPEQ